MSPLPSAWQVTLCDPIWHVSSSSGEACCELLYPVTLLYYYYFTSVMAWTKNIQRKTRVQPPLQLTRDQVVYVCHRSTKTFTGSNNLNRHLGTFMAYIRETTSPSVPTAEPRFCHTTPNEVAPNGRPRPRRTRSLRNHRRQLLHVAAALVDRSRHGHLVLDVHGSSDSVAEYATPEWLRRRHDPDSHRLRPCPPRPRRLPSAPLRRHKSWAP